jgi:anti-anti-sigma factor
MAEESGTSSVEKIGQALVARPVMKMMDDEGLKSVIAMIDKEVAADPGISLVVLDLSQVSYMPSMALGLLVQMSSKCKSRQQQFKLAGLKPSLRQVFSITRLDRVFQFADSVEKAIA